MGNGAEKPLQIISGASGPVAVWHNPVKADVVATTDNIADVQPIYTTYTAMATATIYEDFYGKRIDERLSAIENELQEIKIMLQAKAPFTISTQIRNLSTDKYKLKAPVDVILEIYTDEVLALLPELALCGEGENELVAIDDLKADIVDLLDDLEGIPESELGETPKIWKRSLELMVEKCQ